LGTNFINYVILEITLMVCVLFVGCMTRNVIMKAFSIGMFTTNMIGYLKSFYQATGEFKSYGKVLNIEKFALFTMNMLLIFIVNTKNFMDYIWAQVIIGIVIMIYLLAKVQINLKFIQKGKISIEEFLINTKSGFILMLGNFSSTIFTGLDRWFVKLLMSATCFSLYSFAVSMESVINVFMTPITISMYNYFCVKRSVDKIIQIKRLVLIWGFMIITAAFPAKIILEIYLPKYLDSNSIIFLLFASQAFYVIIKGVYVNLYKARKEQDKYLKQILYMTVLAFLLNAILYFLLNSMQGIALGTLITSMIWLIICETHMPEIRFQVKEIAFLVTMLSTYLLCGYKFNAISGCFIYLNVGLFAMIFL